MSRETLAHALHEHFALEAVGQVRCDHATESDEAHVVDVLIEQILSDETVERVATVLHDRMYDVLADITYPTGAPVSPSEATETRNRRTANAKQLARAVLNAAVEES